MTGPQIEKLKKELNDKYYGGKVRTPNNLNMPITEEDEKTFKELSCREMINSCLIYGDDPFRKFESFWYKFGYCERSYMSDYEDTLGKKRVKELYEEQLADFKKAKVHTNVYEDSEGVTYNAIEW